MGLVADRTLAGFPRMHGLPVAALDSGQHTLTGPAGTAAAYRRAAWEEIGGLDESIFAYMEDFDLGLRLRAAGWKAAAVPEAVGVHLGSATHGRRSAWQRRHGGFARGYLLRRYGILRGRAALRTLLTEAIVVIGDLLISRDAAALKGRLAGWRAGAAYDRLPLPPPEAIDNRIGFRESLQLRRGVYARGRS
jgi:N-acetylglucosaminyl-diphospho-decaprenol L-rhamnosyltransferase